MAPKVFVLLIWWQSDQLSIIVGFHVLTCLGVGQCHGIFPNHPTRGDYTHTLPCITRQTQKREGAVIFCS